jgi:DNA-binding response OmpR family regulator
MISTFASNYCLQTHLILNLGIKLECIGLTQMQLNSREIMGKIIHVVEDDEDIRFIIEYILKDSGFEVELSENATAFIQSMRSTRPDLIILDVMLPDGNGVDLCVDLKKNERTRNIPIIVMSAHAGALAVLEEACADDFISKPFDLDNFLKHVKMHLPA